MALGGFAIGALVINERATQTAVAMFRLHGFYAPWQWIVWWCQWHAATAFQPVWETCTRLVLIPMLMLAGIAVAIIIVARYLLATTSADLYGSARWASRRDLVKADLLAGWLAG